MNDPQPAIRRRSTVAIVARIYVLLALATLAPVPAALAGVNLVRMEGVLGVQNAPGSVAQLTLAIGTKTVQLSLLTAQRISGDPAMAPEIVSALGPGPPPIRVEGRAGMIKQIVDAPPDTRVTITGNLDTGIPFLTLMEVSVAKSAGAQ